MLLKVVKVKIAGKIFFEILKVNYRSTNDGIFLVRNIIQKYSDTIIAVYIDLTAAYDHVPRDFLFRVLSMRTGAHHLIAILKKMYENTTACIRGTEAKFDILIGCRQGGQESPCIFNYYFDSFAPSLFFLFIKNIAWIWKSRRKKDSCRNVQSADYAD